MGLSHFAMVNAHPSVEAIACDTSGFLTSILAKNIEAPVHRDFDALIKDATPDAILIATPSRFHAPMVRKALDAGCHVFCEKPFCLDPVDSETLAALAKEKGLVAQVGYHYRYVAAFQEMKRVLESGALGRITHVLAEAYGPVVLREKRATWRSQKSEGGGCLYDYAAHPLNLLNWYFGTPSKVSGSVMSSVFSEDIDDEVFSTLQWDDGPTAQLSVNWSDESHRKMSTKISMIGSGGRIQADRQECQVYLRQPSPKLPGYEQGWTVKYTTDLTEDRWFYLRGEEYSAQIDEFVLAIQQQTGSAIENGFASAAETDRSLAMIISNAETGDDQGAVAKRAARRRGWFSKRGAS